MSPKASITLNCTEQWLNTTRMFYLQVGLETMAYTYGLNTCPLPTHISKKYSLSLHSTPYPCLSQNSKSQKFSASFSEKTEATTQWYLLWLALPTSVGNWLLGKEPSTSYSGCLIWSNEVKTTSPTLFLDIHTTPCQEFKCSLVSSL